MFQCFPDKLQQQALLGVYLERFARGNAEKGRIESPHIVELAGREIRDIYDLMFVLRESKPGEEAAFVAMRGDERIEGRVTFGESTRR